ncbi:ImmA/IrrE family metallo-endopeptidase [Bacillus cereus group sp. BfR-BA-01316]|uniref:ImmA/IrrE family metallo-endopeptidase n=1 Tax=Bacillus cereus group sp. BfR-BA-01316 TaxID=2920293 RepID=UPI001F59E935|nr:ImmA/IrrE family metallo-endopeptidase [Bacillus cereus group sp. BfR-BA-01316]
MFQSQPYNTTLLEDYIQHLYQSLSILVPEQIDMMEIAKKLNIWLYFAPFGSHAMEKNQIANLIIDNRLSQAEQWEDFGHELCHLLLHSGNQLLMHKMFLDYQETKARNFALQFCVPTFMLRNLPPLQLKTYIIAEKFNVTLQFAERRLLHYENQLLASKLQKQISQYCNLFK